MAWLREKHNSRLDMIFMISFFVCFYEFQTMKNCITQLLLWSFIVYGVVYNQGNISVSSWLDLQVFNELKFIMNNEDKFTVPCLPAQVSPTLIMQRYVVIIIYNGLSWVTFIEDSLFIKAHRDVPADTRCNNKVIITSKRRRDVAQT